MRSEEKLKSIKLIESDDINYIVELHKSVFPIDFISRTIYASSKVECYLSNLIKFSSLQREHYILGWFENKNLIGYCHFRVVSGNWHLDYIAVLPAYQHLGVGKKLWLAGIEEGDRRGFSQVTLDVSQTNPQALNWYQQQGLQIVQKTWVYEKQLSRKSEVVPVELLDVSLDGWEAAEAWQSLYGFSQFYLGYKQRTWTIGRLGSYFRIFEKIPSIIESVLTLIDSERKLLLILSEPCQEIDFGFIDCSYRMQGELV